MLTGRSAIVQAAFPAINNIFFMDFAGQLATALEGKGLRLQITQVRDGKDLLHTLEDSAARRHRLAVFIPPEEGIVVPPALARHLPLAALLTPCRGKNIPFLSPDEVKTGSDGVDYLHRLGHRKIVFLSSRRRAYAISARAEGYRKRSISLGLEPHIVYSPEPASWGQPLPTALFCHNDWLAIQAILALRKENVAVPEQISVLGIDGSPTLAALFPDLTTMAYPVDGLIASILVRLEGKTRSMLGARFGVIPGRTVAALS
jgi:DNA-binding LacI/PurR family transcriptional regulator